MTSPIKKILNMAFRWLGIRCCQKCGGNLVFEKDGWWSPTVPTGMAYGTCEDCGRRFQVWEDVWSVNVEEIKY